MWSRMCALDEDVVLAVDEAVSNSSYVGPAQGAITLRGDVDSYATDQLAVHLDGFLDVTVQVFTNA